MTQGAAGDPSVQGGAPNNSGGIELAYLVFLITL
jgi:hypothetical protein